jgi:hypothetical protein
MAMTETPLRDGVRRLLETVRNEEWTFDHVLTECERQRTGDERAPEITDLLARANGGRRHATQMLQENAAGRSVDDCPEPPAAAAATWAEAHRDAHVAMSALLEALDATGEDDLAAHHGPDRNHPQYLWRHVVINAVRDPMLRYAEWHHRAGRQWEGLAVLSRWYEAVRGSGLPAKARSDASYDLACGFARADRPDDAMRVLPDAFTYNDRAAVGVLKAWAREDGDLRPLAGRADFRTLVGAT